MRGGLAPGTNPFHLCAAIGEREAMQQLVDTLNSWIWSYWLVGLCLGVGLLFSLRTRFLQVRHFRHMLQLLFSSRASDRGISSFQALAVSLSGRVGTGNIAGVAAAIGYGGPGAVFWMWCVAFFGAATAYVEAALGQIYKEEDEGEYRGGPAFYLEKALGQKWYAWLFALSTILATGLLLPTVQANAISTSAEVAFGANGTIETFWGTVSQTRLLVAVVVVGLFGGIIFGGVHRIAHFTQVVVPFMALAYIATALTIVAMNLGEFPRVLALILEDAFTPMAGVGAAIGWGVKRGVYSNEAGQGTGPHAAAAAEVEHPAQQGLVQAFSVYVDTLLVCSSTAFAILITGAYNVYQADGAPLLQNVPATVDANSPAFTQLAVESLLPSLGKPFVAGALFFFAFTTVLAYYYIAETNVAYLRRYFRVPAEMTLLKLLMMASVFYGAVRTARLAWGLGDIGVGLMAWLNIIGILLLFMLKRPALVALGDYEAQRTRRLSEVAVRPYSFDPQALGIDHADFWQSDRLRHASAGGDALTVEPSP
jgi:AGCS family alanine or glycine:cation symporter